jgi:glycosyltransferase involved in cell wall biosynthesis
MKLLDSRSPLSGHRPPRFRPMSVLHVISSLSPRDGGPPEVTRQLAVAYGQIGARMEVLCNDDPQEAFLKDFPCPVHAVGQRWLGKYSLSPRLWGWLHANIDRFDGVVAQGIWTFPCIAVRAAALKAKIRYGVFPHGSLDPWFKERYPLKHIKKMIYWPIQYPVLRDASAVLFTSALEPDLAKQSFTPNKWNSVLYPQGICEPEGDPAAQKESIYQLFPELRDRRFLLFMGRLHTKKGCDLLIESFSRVAPEHPDVDLVVAGPDQEGFQAKLQGICGEKGIGNRVHWPGMIGGNVKWGAFRAAEAFILPSHQENFGLVVAEALSVGTPVLTTNKVNIWPEIQADGAALIEEDTLEGTERLLRGWLEMPLSGRVAMAQRAYACYEARYTMERAARMMEQLFPEPVAAQSAAAVQVFRNA